MEYIVFINEIDSIINYQLHYTCRCSIFSAQIFTQIRDT